ncbi:MAG: Fic family protein [Candidatus Diapherotrites archaeon]
MSYIEKKEVNGKEYFYLSKNIRVSKDKWKKIRKYVGKDLSDLSKAEKELELFAPIKRLLNLKQMKILELLKEEYLKKHKISKSLWKTEKEKMISFIYNTNAIEGNSLSYEETKDILEGKKIKAKQKKRDVREVKNMKKCIDFLFKYKGDFNNGLMFDLHSIQMQGVHSEAGKLRTKQNIVGNYLPPKAEKVPMELDKFFSWFEKAKDLLHPVELAALVHLKFVRIHPFMDGNGRMSRLLMNFILFKNKFPLLNVFNSEKMLYYLVLREVDFKKKERPFVKYIYQTYINQYKEYLLKDKK